MEVHTSDVCFLFVSQSSSLTVCLLSWPLSPAGIFQAMCLLICAEMYQVSRLQHICELFIITQLQSMPSRELASMNLDVVDLLKKAKVGGTVLGWAWDFFI